MFWYIPTSVIWSKGSRPKNGTFQRKGNALIKVTSPFPPTVNTFLCHLNSLSLVPTLLCCEKGTENPLYIPTHLCKKTEHSVSSQTFHTVLAPPLTGPFPSVLPSQSSRMYYSAWSMHHGILWQFCANVDIQLQSQYSLLYHISDRMTFMFPYVNN